MVVISKDIQAYVNLDIPNPPPLKKLKTLMPIDINLKERTILALNKDKKEKL